MTDRLNVPVNTPVLVMLSSKDVIHSFGLPQRRVKQDAVPGIQQPVWFTPTGRASGTSPVPSYAAWATTKGIYEVMRQADYDAGLAEEAALLAPPAQ